jgi:hypothetical protein
MRNPGAIRSVLAVLAAAAAIAAAGCGSSADETAETTPAAPAATTSTTPGGQQAPRGVRATPCDGGSNSAEIRVTGVSCKLGRDLVAGWYEDSACSSPAGASRTSCRVGRFTCLGASADRGIAVTCAGPGRSVSFIGKPR